MAKLPNPVIVIPGITGTYLSDQYVIPPEFCFTVMRKMFDRIALHPDDRRYEAAEPSHIVPDQVFEIVYREIVQELRHNLTDRPDAPVPVFSFGYDWRQPLGTTVERLAGFVDEVIDRTKLLRHYDRDDYGTDPKVNLVGHSMGGLLIGGYLASKGVGARVDKVASLGTPFNGSYEALLKVLTGAAALGTADSSSREREAARITPALYHLMPSFQPILPVDENPAPDPKLFVADFLNADSYQPGVVETLALYIDRYGLGKTKKADLSGKAADLLKEMLADAKAFRGRVDALDGPALDLQARWLCVAGVGSQTRVRIRRTSMNGVVDYDLTSKDRRNEWGQSGPNARWELTGDGTVPFQGAVPKFLESRHVVCVTPDDYGYWEIGDKVLNGVAGFHANLPNMDLLHRLIVAHFTGTRAVAGQHWGRPAPGIQPAEWEPPIKGLPAK